MDENSNDTSYDKFMKNRFVKNVTFSREITCFAINLFKNNQFTRLDGFWHQILLTFILRKIKISPTIICLYLYELGIY